MKRKFMTSIIAVLLLSVAGTASAQENGLLEKLYDRMMTSCVVTTYSYTTEVSGVRIDGYQALDLQNDLWHMKGNGVEIWCDGQTVWTTDPVSKEVVIENAAVGEEGNLTNPALILARLHEWFDVKEERPLQNGRNVLYILAPKPEVGMNIEFFNIQIRKADGMACSGSFAMKDGNTVDIDFISMETTPKKPVSYYRPSHSFDASWIVTDLR